MMYRYLLITLLAFSFYGTASAQKPNDFDTVKVRLRKLLLSDTAYANEQSYRVTDDIIYNKDAAGYLSDLTPMGNWPDINYFSQQPSSWKPSWHLYRTMLLCRAYFKTHDDHYLSAVHRALTFWIAHDFQSSNWWQNQINTPYAFSSLLIMLKENASTTESDYFLEKLAKRITISNATGQNLLWQYDNQARLAIILDNRQTFERLMKGMQSLIKITTGEGIQPDYSFHQHGAMLQFGNYGLHFLNNTVFWLNVTTGTNFAFDLENQRVLFDYCRSGLKWTVFKGAMDVTGIGRQIRHDYTDKRGTDLQDDFQLISFADPVKETCRYSLDGFDNGNGTICGLWGVNGFWCSDYMLGRSGRNYLISVRTHGNGVKKVESINGENLKGAFLNDGVTLIQQTGNEYKNIEPLWNWSMLPGTTCDTLVNLTAAFNTDNDDSHFVGLASNGVMGISTMVYNRLGLSATKSYFLIGDMMVALGAGITTAEKEHVVTTLDQCFLHYPRQLKSGLTSDGRQWILKDSIAYWSLDKDQKINVEISTRKGRWSDIDKASPADMITDTLLTLYLPHNVNNFYAYAIKPSASLKDIATTMQPTTIKILTNTDYCQAIAVKENVLAAFIKEGTLNVFDNSLNVDSPCLLLCKKTDHGTKFWIADPTKKMSEIKIHYGLKSLTVKLPRGNLAGSTSQITEFD